MNWVEDHIDDARYMIQANTLGYPAISLPAGTYKDGLPAGVQLHSKWGNDGLIFKLAAQLERARPENFNMVAPNHISHK